jgi:ribonuclease D
MIAYETILKPEEFRAAITEWHDEPHLWLDTEVANWFTKTPRLSLLQVRNGSGRTWVVDVLQPQMQQVVEEDFVPQIMANRAVEKWAHYARFERKFLGQDRVINLNCTFEMARSIPYYRLPLRGLSLAALVEHFFKITLDKTFQKTDWGVRPLSSAQLEYAASDTEWCYRIYEKLRGIPRPPQVSKDDPAAIAGRYIELLGPLKSARTFRAGIRDAVKEYMISETIERLSRFELRNRTTHSTDLVTLVEFALLADPGEYFDLRVTLSEKLRSLLSPEVKEQIRLAAEMGVSQTFRGPRAPRSRETPTAPYNLNPRDVDGLTAEYEEAEHNVSELESERDELRQRMKLWMQAQSLGTWGDFSFSAPRERWKVDLHRLADVFMREAVQITFPQRLWLAFNESELERLIATGATKQTAVLRWLRRSPSFDLEVQRAHSFDEVQEAPFFDPEVQQSRDWGDASESGEEMNS